MKVAIIGMPKTGTTALYSYIKRSLGRGTFSLFEPKSKREVQGALGLKKKNILIKFMLGKLGSSGFSAEDFDKVVVIVRDPRDFFVSALLYRFNSPGLAKDKSKASELIKLFEKKEKHPAEVSCISLLEAFSEGASKKLESNIQSQFEMMTELCEQNDFFTLKYEDMIDANLEALSDYLGVRVVNEAADSAWTKKISRTKGYGDWKNWFTLEDLNFYSPVMQSFMARFGYKNEIIDSNQQSISPQHCSEYIERLIASSKNDPLHSPDSVNEVYLENLRSAIEDGKSLAMVKMGLLKKEGREVEKDLGGAFALFRIAAKLGNPRAMRELGHHFLSLESDESTNKAIRWYRNAISEGDFESYFHMAKVFSDNTYGRKDLKRAMRLSKKAVSKGVKRGSVLVNKLVVNLTN